MRSIKFRNFVENNDWMVLSDIKHIRRLHIEVDDDDIWNRACAGNVTCATRFTCDERTVIRLIEFAVKMNADRIEKYCYDIPSDEIEPKYMTFDCPISLKDNRTKSNRKFIFGGGYSRYDAKNGNRNFQETNSITVVIVRIPGSGMPRFKVINAFPSLTR